MWMRWIAGLAILAAAVADAEPPPASLDVEGAITYATSHHPTLRADAADVRAASELVEVERARYTPDLEVFAQAGRSTSNAVPGAYFAVPGLPVVAGTPGRTLASHWTTEAGASVSWDALGYRQWDAMIAKAHAEVKLARDTESAGSLDVQYDAADKFIVAIEREQAVAAAKAGVDRAQVFVGIVKASVGTALRAGADLSRAEAELAFAKTALARAEAGRDVALADLRVALGAPRDAVLQLDPGRLAGEPPAALPAQPGADPHLLAAQDRVQVAEAERRAIATGTQPRLALVGAVFARGNGALPGGAGADGLVPDAPNWALGLLLTWPVLADRTVAPAMRAQQARVAREHAQQDALAQELAGRDERARALLAGALDVARNTPDGLRAARDAETQTAARFQQQLATADDVAQTERLLVQAETDDAIARLDVWRALLFVAYADGDLAPFLAAYRGSAR